MRKTTLKEGANCALFACQERKKKALRDATNQREERKKRKKMKSRQGKNTEMNIIHSRIGNATMRFMQFERLTDGKMTKNAFQFSSSLI